ncbi:MAG TPA: [Fe-Fe] hydrogenase large subunit C-terminal domain-containing protein, partial [bacterium]|nr:[Fe-Fe] hydrogenase large subunit C-terminal domain-containing protein [bacterium]
GADLTIIEEASELLHRVKSGGKLPLLTSCSPGWVKYIEHFYPDLLGHVSSCKSPHEMEGALIKSYYAEKTGIPAKDIYVISIMPCIAKKFEAQRPELKEVFADVDAVLTTRELARMIKNAGIDFTKLNDEHFDDPMGESTGAAAIFGAAGGVMEAALRTAHFFLTGKEMDNVEFTPVRGLQGVKEGEVTIAGLTIKIAAVSGLKNISAILDKIRSGENTYQFIEVMACPNGCINGGGQPINSDPDRVRKRMEAIYAIDRTLPKRASHQNEAVMRLYKEYLGEPNGHKAHELLHTHYVERS